jgi:anti-sigma factor RsiW
MNINRHNYEEFFMLYADNELSATDRKAVELFVAANPDLKTEFDLLDAFKLSPDASIVFDNKNVLLKPEAGAVIDADNYESFFILYSDDELNNEEKAAVEQFVYQHPQYQTDFELYQQLKYKADSAIIFENKESLYRKEEAERRVIPIRWWRYAAAAAVMVLAGIFWLLQPGASTNGGDPTKTLAGVKSTDKNKIFDTPATPAATNTGAANNQPVVSNTTAKTPVPAAATTKTAQKNNYTNNKNAENNDALAVNTDINPKTTTPEIINTTADRITANNKTAPVNASINIDAPTAYLNPEGNEAAETGNTNVYASYTSDNKLEVLNTSVSKKTPLRGLLRKATRLVAHRTDDEGKRKGLLIGSFEIAMK